MPGSRPPRWRGRKESGLGMLRAILDTNVVVSGIRSKRGSAFELLRLLGLRRWTLVLSNTLLTEYQEVLHRGQPSLPFTHEEIERFLDSLCHRAEQRRPSFPWWPVLSDSDDEAMVRLAIEGRVDYLVTHNVRHLRPAQSLKVRVVPPGEFLQELRK